MGRDEEWHRHLVGESYQECVYDALDVICANSSRIITGEVLDGKELLAKPASPLVEKCLFENQTVKLGKTCKE